MARSSGRLGRLQQSMGASQRWRQQAATRAQWRSDPIALARACGIEPDPWQAQMLTSTSPRILLNCSRQSGKSTITAIKALHHALYTPHALVLLLSRGLRQSGELMHTLLALYRRLDRPTDPAAESALTLELAEGSARIIALPGSEATIRGYGGVTLLIVDEAARVPDEVYYAIRPMIGVSHGSIIALSTPFGTRGWWYEAWADRRGRRAEDGTPASPAEAWERYEVPARACPRLSAEFLAAERRTMPAWFYEQEYGCAFRDAITQLIPTEYIEAAVRDYPVWNLDAFGWPAQPSQPTPTRRGTPHDTQPQQEQEQSYTQWDLDAIAAGRNPFAPAYGPQDRVPLERIPRRFGGTRPDDE